MMIVIFLLLIFISLILLLSRLRNKIVPAIGSHGKNVVIDEKNINKSYLLLTPFNTLDFNAKSGKVFLVDLYGKPVHVWKTAFPPFYTTLKKNGNIVVASINPSDMRKSHTGKTGLIQEIDWHGKIIWEYKNNFMHHDFEVLPNGHIVISKAERLPREIAQKIKGGVPESELEGDVWTDIIIEINQKGEEVWKWDALKYLNPEEYKLGPLTVRNNWTHINSIRFTECDPLEHSEAFVVSMRNISTVLIIKKDTGKIIWKSPQGMFSYQHDVTFLKNNNILVFDNGLFREQKKPCLYSKVAEVNPLTNQIEWEFLGGKSGVEQASFASGTLGGAQRLSDGNTLITNGLRGHIFEVTRDKKIVWDFINPHFTASTGPWPNNIVFKSRRYEIDQIDWPEKISKPLPILPKILNFILGK